MNNELLQKIENLEQEVASLKASRGLRGFLRHAFKKSSFIIGIAVAAALTGFLAWAAQVTFTDGTVISAAEVNANFTDLYGKVDCNSNFWPVSDGRLCMESTLRGPSNYYTAVSACQGLTPSSRVCTENDILQACGDSYSPLSTSGFMWVGNVQADDYYFITNVTACMQNFLGSPVATGSNYYYRCCY